MTIGKSRALVAIGAIVIVGGGFLYYIERDTSTYADIATFNDCAKAGYNVSSTMPPVCMLPDGRVFTGESTTTEISATSTKAVLTDKVKVSSVSSGDLIQSPLTIKGQARGYWYFEASFPIELIDSTGKTIAMTQGKATSDWMTSDFVPFTADLSFANVDTATGTLILRNDNPSGLPENQEELRIPVRFR